MNNNDFIENESHTESQSCKFAAKISGWKERKKINGNIPKLEKLSSKFEESRNDDVHSKILPW